jgi:hypothetical protein
MKKIAKAVSMLALVATILPALLFFADMLSLPQAKAWMLISALAWYLSAPLWMKIKAKE